ncbi:FAD-dependent oxidoreductase [Pseudoduganella namucuonensis]|uniref:Glycine/D-amino acid oxidase n=1 Tax=Pseudoduganella namucuonensis TaxID=1035707 RepID=A0A1I7HBB4_9BURK|nr:FAD-dependent oxidoreductase [Pseudoduganella namucuonensis]SFU57889.1 Glycine/D-amino acid oxidase [Pseudoduganella namucuonensis]
MSNASNGASTSIWMATSTVPSYAPLAGGVETGVCVIGAGIAGLTTAYLLSREGRKVVLIDALGVGAGETGRTTAHLFPPDEWYAGTEKSFGADGARLIADSFARAIDMVETIIRHEQIDCEFQRLDGYLCTLPGAAPQHVDREYEAARRAGVDAERLQRVPGLSFDTGPCVRYGGQAQFHPLKYLTGLAHAFVRNGGEIHGGTRAVGIEGNEDEQVVTTEGGHIRAQAVVVATNTPFNDRVVMHTKQSGYRSYAIGLRVPKGSVPRMLLWDTGDPYYYVRLASAGAAADHEILVVGGADHKVGQDKHPEHRYERIERWARERFPMAQAVEYRWSGEVMEPADGPAYLGRNPMDASNVYIITGDSGNGMTHCTIGAMLVTDLIMGRANPWQAIYDPARKVKHGISDFVMEQANTIAQYGEWMTAGELDSVREIPAGQGAIVRDGLHKLAVYRDEQGGLHAVSAKCTHLGCVVHWNSAECSWDCPCHASRFATDGTVLHGPAALPLAEAALPEDNRRPPDAGDTRPAPPPN